MRRKIIYVSGSYSNPDKRVVEENIKRHRETAIRIWEIGYTAISPVLNTVHFEREGVRYNDIIEGDLEILSRCDAIFMLRGWHHSKGAEIEYRYASEHNIPIFFNFDELRKWHEVNYRWPVEELRIPK